MDERIIEIIQADIERCKNHTEKAGSYKLYQALVGKYNGFFPSFSSDIPKSGKVSTGGPFDYLPELSAIKEKLEFMLITEQTKDPLYQFKQMLQLDLKDIMDALEDSSNEKTPESAKQSLYASITAKYHPFVPRFGEGLYNVYLDSGVYDDISGKSLKYNLNQIYNKLVSFQTIGFPGLIDNIKDNPNTVITINNKNENNNSIQISFDDARKSINEMTSLPEEDIEEIMSKIDEIETIVQSSDGKAKKWSKAKDIVKWIADKGVDVGISLLPLLLQIK